MNLYSKKFLFSFSLIPFFLIANPSGHKIISGDVAISSFNNNNECIINQNSNKAVVDWENFSIQENEVTKFIQPSSSSAILNRVIGNDMSQIYGTLQSNGQVYLINPNGWVIGPKGFIDTQGFIASTLDLKNEEFLSQDLWHFSGLSHAKIINNGKIIAQNNHVLLIANEIENNGSIVAKNGKVDFMAGYDVLLVPSQDNKVSVGLKKEGQITNKGFIESVETKLQASGGNAYSLAINHEGIIDAIGIEYKDGKAVLISDATTSTNGRIVAKNANETGGKIQILGQDVRLEKATDINASGKNGGGEILVGGDYQGKNPDIQNAKTVYVDKEALNKADALENGNGGKVIFWGNERNDYFGHTSVGAQNGDGGLIEVSSTLGLNYRGTINALSVNGKVGTLLLDPEDVTIDVYGGLGSSNPTFPTTPPGTYTPTGGPSPAQLAIADLTAALAGAAVIVNTSGAGAASGNIIVNTAISSNSAFDLTLNAQADCNLVESITRGGAGKININFGLDNVAHNFTLAASKTLSGPAGSGVLGGNGNNIYTINGTATAAFTGGTGNNTFVMGASASITGAINGGSAGATNKLNYQSRTASNVTVNLGTGSATSISGGVSNINYVVGGTNTNTLTGKGAACSFEFISPPSTSTVTGVAGQNNTIKLNSGINTWTIPSANSGTVGSITFTNMPNAIGGSGTDLFNMTNGSLTSITGGSGITTIQGPNRFYNRWTVSSDYAGSLTNDTTGTLVGSFTNVKTIKDFLDFSNGQEHTFDIYGKIDQLDTSQGNNVAVNIYNGGHVVLMNHKSNTTVYAGGIIDQYDADTLSTNVFVSGTVGNITKTWGNINLVMQASTGSVQSLTVDGGIGFPGAALVTLTNGTIETLSGDPNNTTNRITGPNGGAIFTINGTNAGSVTKDATCYINSFNTIQNFIGGTGNDTFAFQGTGNITGTLNGGSGTNTLDFSAFSSGTPVTVTVNALNGGTTSKTGVFSNIQSILGGAGNDTFTLSAAIGTIGLGGGTNSYTMNAGSYTVGTVNGNTGTNTYTLNGGTITTLHGSTGNDTLTIANTVGTINLNAGTNIVNMSSTGAVTTINGNTGTNTYNINGGLITTLTGGSGSDTIVGPAAGATWTVSAANAGNITSRITNFTGVETLTGNTGNDVFNISGSMGTINTGAGTNNFTMNAGIYTVGTVNGNTGTNTYNLNDGSLTTLNGSSGNDTITEAGCTVTTINLGAGTNGVTLSSGNIGTINGDTGTNTYALNGGSLTTLNGSSSNDTITEAGCTVTTINLGAGTNILTMNSGSVSAVNGSTGTNTYNINGGLISTLTGNSVAGNNDTIVGPTGGGHWAVTGNYAGSLKTLLDADLVTSFTNVETLTGFSGALNEVWTINGDMTTINCSNGNFSSVTMNGGTVQLMTKKTQNGLSMYNNSHIVLWQTNGSGSATLYNNAIIDSITNSIGGVSVNITQNSTVGSIANAGSTMNITLNSPTTINSISASGTSVNNVTVLNGTITSITNTGTGVCSITGPGGGASWSITGLNAGSMTGTIQGNVPSFSGIKTLNGTGGNDSFNFSGTGSLTTINGGAGINSIVSTITSAQTYNITSPNTGSAPSLVTNFSNIHNITGAGSNNIFNFSATGSLSSINGGTGTNSITSSIAAAQIYNITTANTGTAVGLVNNFSNIQNITGAGSGNTFNFSGTGSLSSIDGGAGINFLTNSIAIAQIYNITAANTGTIAGLVNNFSNIQNITGAGSGNTFNFSGTGSLSSIDGGLGNNTITSSVNAAQSWDITGLDTGTAIGLVANFSRVGNLRGSNNNDTFYFHDASHLTGNLDGGGGTNALNYMDYHADITINIPGDTATCVDGTVKNIQNGAALSGDLIGGDQNDTFYIYYYGTANGGGGTNTLVSMNYDNTWTITGPNAGTIDTIPPPVGHVSFTNIQKLQGGGQIDTFNVPTNGLVQSINGDGGNDTIVGPNAPTTWTIDGVNSGNFHGSGTTVFNTIENLTAGSDNDTFYFYPGAQITGTLDGGAGTNVLDLSNYGSAVKLQFDLGSSTSGTITGSNGIIIQHFTNMQQFILPVFLVQQSTTEAIVATVTEATLPYTSYYPSLIMTSPLITEPPIQQPKITYNASYDPVRSRDATVIKEEKEKNRTDSKKESDSKKKAQKRK
jgi:hypothetical protein